jgi:hypothetical protein
MFLPFSTGKLYIWFHSGVILRDTKQGYKEKMRGKYAFASV